MDARLSYSDLAAGPWVRSAELDSALAPLAAAPAEGGDASAAPLPGRIVSNIENNRYSVQLLSVASDGPPQSIEGKQVQAINLAEPFDQTGQLAPDSFVLCWPSQGLYLLFVSSGGAGGGGTADYWAVVVSGGGPDYQVRRQIADGPGNFADAPGAESVTACNVWELSVDAGATADVPAGAVVRVWQAPDADGQVRQFFFYPIHAVYR